MGQRFYSHNGQDAETMAWTDIDDAAAVYPDHDIVTRHFDAPLTIGDFVSAIAEGARGMAGCRRICALRSTATQPSFVANGR